MVSLLYMHLIFESCCTHFYIKVKHITNAHGSWIRNAYIDILSHNIDSTYFCFVITKDESHEFTHTVSCRNEIKQSCMETGDKSTIHFFPTTYVTCKFEHYFLHNQGSS